MFNGNWLLAIAAYNCGQFKVASAAKRAGTHNFWNLHLPRETTFYVPRLLAVAEIIENPTNHLSIKAPGRPALLFIITEKSTFYSTLFATTGSEDFISAFSAQYTLPETAESEEEIFSFNHFENIVYSIRLLLTSTAGVSLQPRLLNIQTY